MFDSSSPEELVLQLGNVAIRVGTLAAFEFALAGRTGMPAERIADLLDATDEALLKEADGIRKVEKRFSDVLSGAIEDITSIGPFLQGMDLAVVSQDHDWRAIIKGLNDVADGFESHKKAALVRYLQYLTARQEVIKAIYSRRQREKQVADARVKAAESTPGDSAPAMGETYIIDLSKGPPQKKSESSLGRLPKGETVELSVDPATSVGLRLGHHDFSIIVDDGLRFVGEPDTNTLLHAGRNIVGRDSTADVVVDGSLRDISRKHLIIETDGQGFVKLTDISSLGTYVPRQYLDQAGL